MRLGVQLEVGERLEKFEVTFPDLYPYFRFEIAGPDLGLGHHQNPFSGALCLIGRATEEWRVTDTLASFLTTRLPLTLEAGASEDPAAVADREQRQAEPFSDYYPYLSSTILMVDSGWDLGEATHGFFEAAVGIEGEGQIRGIVLEVRDERGSLLGTTAGALGRPFAGRIRGRWVRSATAIPEGDPVAARERAAQMEPSLRQFQWQRVGRRFVEIVGVVFPEEVRWRETGDGWLFLVSLGGPRR